jgi:transposase
MQFRKKKADQSLSIEKDHIVLLRTHISVCPTKFGLIRITNKKDKKYEKFFKTENERENGVKHNHGIKFLKTRTGKYYFAIPYDVEVKDTAKQYKVGSADPGIRTFLTTYNTQEECISFGEDVSSKLARYLKLIKEREMRASKCRRKKAKNIRNEIRLLHEKIKNKVNNLHYDVIPYLIQHEKFLLPHFNSREIIKKNINKMTKKEMSCLAHYRFSQRLIHKAEEVGCEISISNEYRTTMTCGVCFRINRSVGSSKIFNCEYCGLCTGRDVNAGRNNLLKYVSSNEVATDPHALLGERSGGDPNSNEVVRIHANIL